MNVSRFEYEQMKARMEEQRRKALGLMPVNTKVGVDKESDLHNAILDYCRQEGFIAFHGAMCFETSRTIGEPDFEILMPQGKTLFVECKAKGRKLSNEQIAIKAWMERLGHTMHVVTTIEQFREIVRITRTNSIT